MENLYPNLGEVPSWGEFFSYTDLIISDIFTS